MADLTVWKFTVPLANQSVVSIPLPATILSAAAVGPRELALWAVVDPELPPLPHAFELRGTGHPLGRVGSHVATIQDPPYVWHLFRAHPATAPSCGHWVEGSDGAVVRTPEPACVMCAAVMNAKEDHRG